MKRKIICLLWLSIPLLCVAQNRLSFNYEYDDAGNRVRRKVIIMKPDLTPPSTAPDSTTVLIGAEELVPLMTPDSAPTALQEAEYFIEKLGQVEMKIYPNPTTEKITLQISNMENLQTGTFKLFSTTGQFLQELSIYSATTTISLARLPKGTYILRVHINNRTEDWKIIKQ
ncbi:MAG: T9SS type A sorting domain-containing protein [Bacteroidetes bacterium]|nr:T9SS type A sorting domain-containing protein [Bacteroidota bacterium]MCL2303377.1 T9SS type A sorting domain-containing protein [Lentimicrobiaceae bacterium]